MPAFRASTGPLDAASQEVREMPIFLVEVAASLMQQLLRAAEASQRPELAAVLQGLADRWTPVVRHMGDEAQAMANGLAASAAVYAGAEAAAAAMDGGAGGVGGSGPR